MAYVLKELDPNPTSHEKALVDINVRLKGAFVLLFYLLSQAKQAPAPHHHILWLANLSFI